jgi:hypothetical protein
MLAGLLVTGPVEADWSPGPMYRDRVTVTYVAPEPCCGSGVVAVYFKIIGTPARHGSRAYLMPFMVQGQKAPKVGERCTLSYHRYDVNGLISGETGSSNDGARVISAFRCGNDRARRPGD